MLYEFDRGSTAPEATKNIQASRFQRCHFDDEALQALLDADPHQTTRELVEQLNCHHSTVERHLHALGKRPALANQKAVNLLHDNSRPHVAQLTQQKIEQLGWEVLPRPPWSPDLAPSDYHLFLSLRNYLCNKHYEDFNELKLDLTAFFESKPSSFYRRGIEILSERWANVVENNGDYIVD
ncbi:unnamed protein product [Rotaria socialis]|uniref:Transposase n=1 Tax=Rotaria socialis TaxID=392032 RepID=A0A818BTD2_9BILA|nr:unnamed protein product [Rotaria socialis]